MRAKKIWLILILVMTMFFCGITTEAENVDLTKTFNQQQYLMDYPKIFQQYPLEVVQMADKLEKRKDKYYLEYKDRRDLLETLHLIWVYSDKTFTMEHVTAIAIKESKLNHLALNRKDGGKGLMQVMRKYWKKELPYYTNPYDKQQSIRAGVDVLHLIKSEKKCSTWEATRLYNGNSSVTYDYRQSVKEIYKDIRSKS